MSAPNKLAVGNLTVEVEEHGDGTLTLSFQGTAPFRVRRAKMGKIPVPIRFKAPKDTVISLTIEPVVTKKKR